jgi:glutathione S-transferase
MPRLLADTQRLAVTKGKAISPDVRPVPRTSRSYVMVGTLDVLQFVEEYLSKHPYFGGQQFSAVDIMMHLSHRVWPEHQEWI